ncbi:MAG: hypothetical protein WBM96_03635 [Polyangiales bacterium]
MNVHQLVSLAAFLTVLVSNASMAQSEDQGPSQQDERGTKQADTQEAEVETGEPEEELKNALLFGFSHAFRLIREQGSDAESASRRTEQVYGFLFGYERVLHRYLALSIIKPFDFNRELVESPLEIVLTGLYRKNSWEPFLGAGVVSTIARVTDTSSEPEAETTEFSVGILFVTGFKYFLARNWAIEIELGYEFVPKGRAVEHAFADTYQGAYFF